MTNFNSAFVQLEVNNAMPRKGTKKTVAKSETPAVQSTPAPVSNTASNTETKPEDKK